MEVTGGLMARLIGRGGHSTEPDPIASLKAADRWLETLPLGDVLQLHEAISAQLKRFNDSPSHLEGERLAILMRLDEKSHALLDTLANQYLRNPHMQREAKSRLWHTLYGLHWEAARGYLAFLLNPARLARNCVYKKDVPRLALRAGLHFKALLTWRAVRYLKPSEKLWQRLHGIIQIAEGDRFDRLALRAYDDDPTPVTVEAVYTQALMLDLANTSTFYPRQIGLMAQWLASWQCPLKLETRPDSEHQDFTVDLAADRGPRRLRKPDPARSVRYWSVAPLLATLENNLAALKHGAAPGSLGLGDDVRSHECIGLLERLIHQWSGLDAREQRRAARVETKRRIELVHGIHAVMQQFADRPQTTQRYQGEIEQQDDDLEVSGFVTERSRLRSQFGAAALDAHTVERWVMHDESACGFDTTVESGSRDWLRVGELVAIQLQIDARWVLGVIRRLTHVDGSSSAVGIETLASGVERIRLHDNPRDDYTVSSDDPRTSSTSQHEALWLTDADSPQTLILDPVLFQPGRMWQVSGVESFSRIRLVQALQRGDGWMRVRFEAV